MDAIGDWAGTNRSMRSLKGGYRMDEAELYKMRHPGIWPLSGLIGTLKTSGNSKIFKTLVRRYQSLRQVGQTSK